MLFKQTFLMLWQNKYFAFLSLFGIGITVAVIMAFFIVLENKTGNIAPEVNADRMVFLGYYKEEKKRGKDVITNRNVEIRRELAEKYMRDLTSSASVTFSNSHSTFFSLKGIDELVSIIHTDESFWNIYRFEIISGNGFTREAFERSDKVALISRYLAENLFPGENPIGKAITIDISEYRISGVVENVSPVCRNAYAQLWTPCFEATPMKESCKVAVLLKEGVTREMFDKEVNEVFERVNKSEEYPGKKMFVTFNNRLDQVLNDETDFLSSDINDIKNGLSHRAFKFRWFGLLGAFLLIIVSNLMGVNMTRIHERSVEMGIRKAFGADRSVLSMQLLVENIIVCLSGGIIGAFAGYATVCYFKKQLFISQDRDILQHIDVVFTPGLIWIAAGIILLFWLLSSVIPVYRLIRTTITDDLKEEL